MYGRRYSMVLTAAALVVLGAAVRAEASETGGIPFEDYDFHQYIQVSGPSPHDVIKLDTNAELIQACVTPCTRASLEEQGVLICESQIEMLKAWRLLDEEEETLITAFPILGRSRTEALRMYSVEAAADLASTLRPHVARIASILDSLGRRENTYTILFSYILDGLVWDSLREAGIIEERTITAAEPFWAGVIWAVYPPRDFSMGTNTIKDRGISMSVNWTERAIPKMLPFVTDWKNFGQMFDDYVSLGRVVDQDARSVFGPYGLFDKDGVFGVPVLTERPGDVLFEASYYLADLVAARLPQILDIEGLAGEFGVRDSGEALVVVYHEIMWDLMDQLESDGDVAKPVALAFPERASSSDIGALVFIVRTEQ